MIEDAFFIDKEHFFKDYPKRFEIKNATQNDRIFPKNFTATSIDQTRIFTGVSEPHKRAVSIKDEERVVSPVTDRSKVTINRVSFASAEARKAPVTAVSSARPTLDQVFTNQRRSDQPQPLNSLFSLDKTRIRIIAEDNKEFKHIEKSELSIPVLDVDTETPYLK